jgi:hypothetical protein
MIVAELAALLGLKIDGKSFQAADKLLTGLKTYLVGLVAHRGWNFLTSSLDQVTSAASKAVEESQKLGVSVETLQELGHAADLSGSSFEGATGALKKFSKFVGDASKGSKENRKALKELNLDYKKLADGTIPLDEGLLRVADKFKGMKSVAERNALAMKYFGRSGVDLIPLLSEGREGIEALRKEAHELGLVLDEETAQSLEAFGDDQDRLKKSVTGVKNEVVRLLLPTLSKMLKSLLEWIKANRKLIAQRIEKMIRALIVVLKLVGQVAMIAAKAFDFLSKNMGLVTLAATSLAAAMIILQRHAIRAAIANALVWAGGIAAAALYALAVAAVILIMEDLYRAVTGGGSVFEEMYKVAKTWIGDKLTALIGGAKILIQQFLGMETDPEKAIRKQDEKDDVGIAQRRKARLATEGRDQIEATNAQAEKYFKEAFLSNFGDLESMKYIARGTQAMMINPNMKYFFPKGQSQGQQANSLTQHVTVNVPPGTDANGVAKAVSGETADGWDQMMRAAQSGVGGGGVP